mmetsp:Transcript_4535/g.9003  ORF Transcript_4535/g.9003 Transcript_4535/m.9003 type:complete len:431 (+) Transcript_4535:44-1336(+)
MAKSSEARRIPIIFAILSFIAANSYLSAFKLTRSDYSEEDLGFSSPKSLTKNATVVVIPNNSFQATAIASEHSFSACLLVMDDNHRLPEWLAYHYYALPLRHVVIASDPASRNPLEIPIKWFQLMNITIWEDKDFLPRDVDLLRKPSDTPDERRSKNIRRHTYLLHQCSIHLKRLNRTWTAYHDIDEYLTISEDFFSPDNPRFASEEEFFKATSPIPNRTAFMSEPGFVLRLLQKYTNEPNITSPTHDDLSKTCFHAPRAKYSAVESPRELTQKGVPFYINADRLDTLRYRYRTTRRKLDRNGLAKGVIDLSRIQMQKIGAWSLVHRPLPYYCTKRTVVWNYGHIPLGIQHYLGSLESFSYRSDGNTKRKGWYQQAFITDGGPDDEIRPWIQGFCDSVGPTLALELLKGAGILPKKVDDYNSAINSTFGL